MDIDLETQSPWVPTYGFMTQWNHGLVQSGGPNCEGPGIVSLAPNTGVENAHLLFLRAGKITQLLKTGLQLWGLCQSSPA